MHPFDVDEPDLVAGPIRTYNGARHAFGASCYFFLPFLSFFDFLLFFAIGMPPSSTGRGDRAHPTCNRLFTEVTPTDRN